jgi:hypothetical protein
VWSRAPEADSTETPSRCPLAPAARQAVAMKSAPKGPAARAPVHLDSGEGAKDLSGSREFEKSRLWNRDRARF